MRHERVGEHSAVVWKFVYSRPRSAIRLMFGVSISPPNGSIAEKPTSSSTMYTTLGVPSGAIGWVYGPQSGTDSVTSTLTTPLNGLAINPVPSPLYRGRTPSDRGPSARAQDPGLPATLDRQGRFRNRTSRARVSTRTPRRGQRIHTYTRLMGQAIGQVLALGIGVALSPVPIIAVVLMLATPKGRVNGPSFLAGWVVGIAVLGTIVLLVASGASASKHGTPATWASILKIVLGLLLVLLAVKQWRGRPRGDASPELPKWMKTVDTFTPGRSVAMGVALSSVNPKNLLLVVAAATAIAQTGASTGDQAVALIVFIVIATLGVGAPVAIYYLMGDRATKILGDLHDWMARENATIMAVICLIIGAKLIGDAISALAT